MEWFATSARGSEKVVGEGRFGLVAKAMSVPQIASAWPLSCVMLCDAVDLEGYLPNFTGTRSQQSPNRLTSSFVPRRCREFRKVERKSLVRGRPAYSEWDWHGKLVCEMKMKSDFSAEIDRIRCFILRHLILRLSSQRRSIPFTLPSDTFVHFA